MDLSRSGVESSRGCQGGRGFALSVEGIADLLHSVEEGSPFDAVEGVAHVQLQDTEACIQAGLCFEVCPLRPSLRQPHLAPLLQLLTEVSLELLRHEAHRDAPDHAADPNGSPTVPFRDH